MAVPCATCRLPAAVRNDVVDQHRRGVSLRDISAGLAERGHVVSRDAVHRHLNRCVAPPDEYDTGEDPAGLMVAVAVSHVLDGWPNLANRLAERLMADGAVTAARIVLSRVPESLRLALDSVTDEDVTFALEATALTRALRDVLPAAPPEFVSALTARVRELGADDLADALGEVAGHEVSNAEH